MPSQPLSVTIEIVVKVYINILILYTRQKYGFNLIEKNNIVIKVHNPPQFYLTFT